MSYNFKITFFSRSHFSVPMQKLLVTGCKSRWSEFPQIMGYYSTTKRLTYTFSLAIIFMK